MFAARGARDDPARDRLTPARLPRRVQATGPQSKRSTPLSRRKPMASHGRGILRIAFACDTFLQMHRRKPASPPLSEEERESSGVGVTRLTNGPILQGHFRSDGRRKHEPIL